MVEAGSGGPGPMRPIAAVLAALLAMFVALFVVRSVGAVGVRGLPILMLLPMFAIIAVAARLRRAVAPTSFAGEAAAGYEQGRRRHLRRERAILEAASRNRGRVTPAQAAMAGDDLSMVEAKELLDALARQGVCVLESDVRGQVYYDFNLQAGGEPGEELSPEEWVEAAAARMSGPADTDESISLR